MDEQVLINFFSQVEGGYHPNPYHNSMHGADVLHIVHFIMSSGELKERCHLSEEDVFAAVTAGMIHDFDHPGSVFFIAVFFTSLCCVSTSYSTAPTS